MSVFSLLQNCSATLINAKWVFKVKMVSEMEQGFTIPVKINFTSHSKCHQYAILITNTIIPKRKDKIHTAAVVEGLKKKNSVL